MFHLSLPSLSSFPVPHFGRCGAPEVITIKENAFIPPQLDQQDSFNPSGKSRRAFTEQGSQKNMFCVLHAETTAARQTDALATHTVAVTGTLAGALKHFEHQQILDC